MNSLMNLTLAELKIEIANEPLPIRKDLIKEWLQCHRPNR